MQQLLITTCKYFFEKKNHSFEKIYCGKANHHKQTNLNNLRGKGKKLEVIF